jgi:hypothetical protein
MRTSKLAKSILNYLPVLAVIAVAVIGIILAREPYQTAPASGTRPTTQFSAEKDTSPQLLMPFEAGTCFSQELYTSLPPKCRTQDGSFIQIPGTSPDGFVIPPGK